MQKKTIIFIVMNMGVVPPTLAQTTPAQVTVAEQQTRDSEKIQILQAELTEQKQILADLQKTHAVQMADNDTEAMAKTENRLEELNANIKQLQQEIALADGSANKPVVVKPVQPVTNTAAAAQKTVTTGPWWDLYNKPPQAAQ